jgi:hypothetical protein
MVSESHLEVGFSLALAYSKLTESGEIFFDKQPIMKGGEL